MDKLSWIKELVQAENQMEESGLVDFSAGFDPDRELGSATLEFMRELKEVFVDSASTFNQLKGSSVGRIKIYGISNTQADFMLFRNGFKLMCSVASPGRVVIKFLHMGLGFVPGQIVQTPEASVPQEQDIIESSWGAFGDLVWLYQGQPIKIDYLVRYYLSRFVRESTK